MRWAMAYPCSGPGCSTRKTNMPRVPGSISVLAIGFQGLDYLCLETSVKGIGEQGFSLKKDRSLGSGSPCEIPKRSEGSISLCKHSGSRYGSLTSGSGFQKERSSKPTQPP